MPDYKFIFTGTPGAGKTTAISTISDTFPVVTDASTAHDLKNFSTASKIAMDFAEIALEDNTNIHLYGVPGQRRFKFMWDIIIKNGLGLIILVDHSRPSPLDDLDIYLDNFSSFIKETGAVIGITKMHTANKEDLTIEDYFKHLKKRKLNLPIYPSNVIKRSDVITLLNSLMASLEYS